MRFELRKIEFFWAQFRRSTLWGAMVYCSSYFFFDLFSSRAAIWYYEPNDCQSVLFTRSMVLQYRYDMLLKIHARVVPTGHSLRSILRFISLKSCTTISFPNLDLDLKLHVFYEGKKAKCPSLNQRLFLRLISFV
jgi:hypothetical protein